MNDELYLTIYPFLNSFQDDNNLDFGKDYQVRKILSIQVEFPKLIYLSFFPPFKFTIPFNSPVNY